LLIEDAKSLQSSLLNDSYVKLLCNKIKKIDRNVIFLSMTMEMSLIADDKREHDSSPKARLSALLSKELRHKKDSYGTVVNKIKHMLENVVNPRAQTSAQDQQTFSVPFLQDVSVTVKILG